MQRRKQSHMMKKLMLMVIIVAFARKGLTVSVSVGPVPSGSIVGSFEEPPNATTLTCNVTNQGTQIDTHWNLKNFRGASGLLANFSALAPDLFLISGDPVATDNSSTFFNKLTILNWTSALDRVIVYCGGEKPHRQLANFTLRLYLPPGAPHTLSIENTEATSIRVHWEAPVVAISPISYYLITARNLNDTGELDIVANTTTSVTISSVTGLLPGTTYELTVVAVSHGGDVMGKSEPSKSVVAETAAVTAETTTTADAIIGGVLGALLVLATLILIAMVSAILKKRSKMETTRATEANVEALDNSRQVPGGQNLEMENCPAYGAGGQNVEMENCPAYGAGNQNVEMEGCFPVYESMQ